ncbi:MAG: helix-turn-helix transcriptional regulator [Clostridia bacterium]|nr:helix-turn-helix transcriptional regulator [Clostridia bacterium]
MKFFNTKEYYTQIKSNKLFKNTVITYTIIACALFFTFSIITTVLMSNAAIKQLTDAEQKMLIQAENTSDSILRNINYSITDTFENNKTIQDALSKPYSPLLSLQITHAISTIQNSFDAIDKVYLFNLSNDIIYTGDNPVYSSEDFPDKELLEYIRTAHKYTINKPMVLKFEDEYATNKIVEKRMLASIYKLDNNRAMAVFIDSDSFNSFVNIPLTHTNQSMTILNSDGIVISSTDEALFGADMSNDKVYRKLLSQNDPSGTLKYRGKVYFYRTAQTMNTFYISEIHRSDIISSFALQFIFILLFGIILIFLLFASSIRLSASIYRPFKRLRQSIGNILNIDDGNAETGTDEDLKQISKKLSDIKTKYDAMQTTEMLYTNSKRNELVYNIISGAYNFDLDTLAEYNIKFPYTYTTIILFRLDNTKKIKQSDIGLIQYGIANVATEIMTNHEMLSYSTSFGGEYDIAFIVNHRSGNFDTQIITQIQKYINSIFSITATASYDTVIHDIDNISQSYRNAEYAIQYRLIKGHNSIISYSSLRNTIKDSDIAYPHELEKDIINAVKSRNDEAVTIAATKFIQHLSVMPYMYITVYSCMLIMTIDMYTPNSGGNDRDTIADDLTKIETIDALLPIIQTKCSNAMVEDDASSSTKYNVIANNIEKYIDENYTDPNLSIHVIASYVNKSANYTRNIFKQIKGISISDYITKKRFSEVCRLLIETNLTAQTISQQTGMSSGSYFYTAFKKYTGYTPEQFRKKYIGTDFNPEKI